MNVQKYKCAIIQYSCEECYIAKNYNRIFDFDKGKYFEDLDGQCSHFLIKFHLTLEDFLLNFFFDLECNNCSHKETQTLISDKTVLKDNDITVTLKCKCGQGALTIGILFFEDIIEFENEEEERGLDNPPSQIKENDLREDEKIRNEKENNNNLNNINDVPENKISLFDEKPSNEQDGKIGTINPLFDKNINDKNPFSNYNQEIYKQNQNNLNRDFNNNIYPNNNNNDNNNIFNDDKGNIGLLNNNNFDNNNNPIINNLSNNNENNNQNNNINNIMINNNSNTTQNYNNDNNN